MKRATIAAIVVILAIALPPSAHAADLDAYTITITPSGETTAHFTLELSYRTFPSEGKTNGFKFLGKNPVTHQHAHTLAGIPLKLLVAPEAQSGEYKAEFDLPPRESGYAQVVVLEFDQDLDLDYRWGGRVADITWAHQFKIPVGRTTVSIRGPLGEERSGFTCQSTGEQRSCTRTEKTPFPLHVPLADPHPPSRVPWMFVLVACAASLGLLARWRATQLTLERGILPPAPVPAYPVMAQAGYRAPPPVPPASSLMPMLAGEDRTMLIRRVVVAALLLVASQVAIAKLGIAPIPIVHALTAAALVTTLAGVVYIWSDKNRLWLLFVAAGLSVLLSINLVVAVIMIPIAGIIGVFALIIGAARRAGGGFGGSSGYSSSSSSWSGSSSSCGGGGGGGCGGGGGGGGCGG